MPTTYSNDIDFVRPTQYTVPLGKKAKQPSPQLWILPASNSRMARTGYNPFQTY